MEKETINNNAISAKIENWPKVAIIVLNWNGWQDTIECLESLQQITYPNYQIIVVDNGSTDGSVEKIKAWARGEIPVESKFFEYNPNTKPVQWVEYDRQTAEAGGIPEEEDKLAELPSSRRIILIQTGENLGFAGGNNVGIKYALRAENSYICLLNNDTIIDPQCLGLCTEILNENKYIGAVSPKILWYDEPQKIWYAGAVFRLWRGDIPHIGMLQPDSAEFSGIRSTEHVTGCAMLSKRELFEEVGLFNEEYPDFDSCNLKTLIYQGIKSLFFVYSTTVSLRINLGIFIPKALNI